MSSADLRPPTLEDLLRDQEQVISHGQALCDMSSAQLAWLVSSGRWQRPFPRAYVAHSRPLTTLQWAWAGWACAWPDGILSCHTAAALDGLRGFERPEVHVMTFLERQLTKTPLLVPHRSSYAGDIHPLRAPARTRLPRSLVDMTTHADSIDDATAILAAGVQQRLVSAGLLRQELEKRPTLRWRAEMLAVCDDLAGGSHSVIEIEAMRLFRRYHLPLPRRQVRVTLPDGMARVDCLWNDYSVVAELDGRMHMDPAQWVADLDRQNELTLGSRTVLRYPLWALRHHHAHVADQLRRALTAAGWLSV